MSVSADLGTEHVIELASGPIAYRERGAGPALVFVHGALVNGDLWRKVVPTLADRFRCVTPDLPLGAHSRAMAPDADLSPPGLADLLAELIERVVGGPAILVGNDTGGGIVQVVVARHPGRVAGLVLTTCDAFWNFPPHSLKPLQPLCYAPGAVRLMTEMLRLGAARRALFGLLARSPVPADVLGSWCEPAIRDRGVRRDFARFFGSIRPRHTRRAARSLAAFEQPALVAWTGRVPFFPARHGPRLARLIPNARFERIEGSRVFVPEDQPERLAELIRETFAGS